MKIITPNYNYTGWEISPDCLMFIQELIVEKNLTKLDIVEFGSGKSTELLLSFKSANAIPGVFDSFDADPVYASSYAKIRNIVSYDGRPVCFGNDYSFYDIREGDLTSNGYNLVVLDGHHGHGRSIAWKFLKDRLGIGCLVVIDDYDHYPFVEDFKKIFPNNRLIKEHWETSNRWVIYEIV
jgi:hypothetical protein